MTTNTKTSNTAYSYEGLASLLVLLMRVGKNADNDYYGSFNEQIKDFAKYYVEGTRNMFLEGVHLSYCARTTHVEISNKMDAAHFAIYELITLMEQEGFWHDCLAVDREHIFELAGIAETDPTHEPACK
jgi:hypothetical protein